MTHLPHGRIKATMLFDNRDHFGRTFPRWPAVLEALNANLAPEADPFKLLNWTNRDTCVVLSNSEFHVIAERHDDPLEQSEFGTVNEQEFYALHEPDLLEAVRDHRCAIQVSVGQGPAPTPARPVAEKTGTETDQAADILQHQMQVLQAANLAFYDFFMPSAVYWGQSDQLFAGPRFRQLARRTFSPVLYLNPDFFGSGAEVDGTLCLGVQARGASDIVGKSLIVEENTNPGMDSYKLAVSFVLVCRHFGRVLETGETFRYAAGAPAILVTHEPATRTHRKGLISLRPASGEEAAQAVPRRRTPPRTTPQRAPLLAARDTPAVRAQATRRWGAMVQAALILGCVYFGSGLFNQTVSAQQASLSLSQLLAQNSESYAKLSAPTDVTSQVLASAERPEPGKNDDF